MSWESGYAAIRSLAELGVEVLFHLVWQGLLVGLVFGGLHRLLAQHSASSRYALLACAMMLLACMPIVTYATLLIRHHDEQGYQVAQRVLPSQDADLMSGLRLQGEPNLEARDEQEGVSAGTRSKDRRSLPSVRAVQPSDGENWVSLEHSVFPVSQNWQVWLFGGYVSIVCVLVLKLVRAIFGGNRLCRGAASVTDPKLLNCLDKVTAALKLRVRPRLAYSAGVAVPTVVGLWRATVLFPVTYASSLTICEMEAILFHELAHVRRHDFAVNVLQRIVEAVYFFHPVAWWLSYQLRVEREYCCDDLVIARGPRAGDYASVLLRVAELACPGRVTAADFIGVHATNSPSRLRLRISRLLGAPSERQRLRLSTVWPWAICLSFAFLLGHVLLSDDSVAAHLHSVDDEWGQPSGGLQLRVISVAANVDEQHPHLAVGRKVQEFEFFDDVTVLAELKNVSEKPILLQGVRYGDSVAEPWVGKSSSDKFAPFLFSCRIFDEADELVAFPRGTIDPSMWMLAVSSGQAERVAPGDSISMILKPLRWERSVIDYLAAGNYELEIAYHGTPKPVRDQIALHWPKRDLIDVWWGAVTGPKVPITIRSGTETMPQLNWGEPKDGMRVAAEYRLADKRAENLEEYSRRIFPMHARLDVTFHFQNVTDEAIEFESDTWIQECSAYLIYEDGSQKQLSQALYTGFTLKKTWRLEPGQIVAIPSIPIGVTTELNKQELPHPIGAVIEGEPGDYRLRHEVGSRSTGETKLTVRARTEKDDPPRIEATFRFDANGDAKVEGGFVEVRRQGGGQAIYTGEIPANRLTISTAIEPLNLYVRMKGFEETTFYDVLPMVEGESRILLKRASPIRFQLEDAEGNPIAGAQVHRFNRSKEKAGSDPMPSLQRDQPAFAVSQADGSVVLDSVSEGDSNNARFGKDVYWFCIEHDDFADRYIGPVTAGSNLGKIKLSPAIEISGTIIGSDEELDRFRADFDQPVAMRSDKDAHPWSYAVSKQMAVKRVGKKLTFKLSGLRPGKLRIIGNFAGDSEGIRYNSGKREPIGNDLVWEFDLQDSRGDVILSRQTATSDAGQ